MHQAHNLPRDTFVSNFEYVHEDKRFTPPRTGYSPLGRPNQAAELNHFTRKMISTIKEFSKTESRKYPPPGDLRAPDDDNLFSDKYPEYLDSENQKLSYWIKSAHIDRNGEPFYGTAHGYLCWGHHFGVHRIVEAALIPDIFWNFISASGRLASGAYKNATYGRVVKVVTVTMDYEAQQIPHWVFYGIRGRLDDKERLPNVDPVQLHGYLKHLFRLFYCYNMVMV
ncbi:hypothetical protein AN958_12719 [Leucoagaricus sp. SymC.cos]|nr:hypothetical protein AN958_12719 [Leucoagaricus sp. SymC.cos]